MSPNAWSYAPALHAIVAASSRSFLRSADGSWTTNGCVVKRTAPGRRPYERDRPKWGRYRLGVRKPLPEVCRERGTGPTAPIDHQ
jgi:hypothetical protein